MAETLNFPLEAVFPLLGCAPVEGVARRVVTDTRQLRAGDLFVAISGERFDGHDFVAQAHERGAVGAVVSRRVSVSMPQCVVADTRRAYGEIARWHRLRVAPEAVVGITGSNGKTSTKGMMAAVLSQVGETHATSGNLNNDLGVPATLLGLTWAHRFAVVEMGANHVGEIGWLASLVQPQVGIITQAAEAHVGPFGSLDNIVRAKGELIDGISAQGVVVLNRDSVGFDRWRARAAERGLEVIAFGQADPARVRLLSVAQARDGVRLALEDLHGRRRTLRLPLWGEHQAWNAAAVVAAAQWLGLDWAPIEAGLSGFAGALGRMQPLPLRGGGVLVDDSYNANPASVRAAVASLSRLDRPLLVCLGPLAELGAEAPRHLALLGRWLKEQGVAALWGLGEALEPALSAFGADVRVFEGHEQMAQALRTWLRAHPDGVALIKGSRSAAMERIIDRLRQDDADLFV